MADVSSTPAGYLPWAVVQEHDPGLQRLAIAILERALDDLSGYTRGLRPSNRPQDASPYVADADNALCFLCDSVALTPYCELAGVSAAMVQEVARKRLGSMLCKRLRHLAIYKAFY